MLKLMQKKPDEHVPLAEKVEVLSNHFDLKTDDNFEVKPSPLWIFLVRDSLRRLMPSPHL
jgi:hypothetical protein